VISIISGNSQQARTGTALPDPLVVEVTDADDNVISNVNVQWSTQGGSLSPQEGATNAEGRTSSVWTLGSSTGAQSATAAVGSLSAQFSATATEIPVGSVEVSPAVAVVPVQATEQMTAVVRDSDGGVLNRPVAWSSSNSNVAQVSNTGVVTGVSPGLATIKATAGGVDGTAEVTVIPGAPAAIAGASGNGQQATAGTALANPLVAKVTDAGGNPVPDVSVQWTAQHGSVQPTSGTTNADGEASTTWTLGTGEGTQRAHATAGSLTVQFTATATPAPVPVASVEVSPDSADVVILGTVQLEATVRDSDGNVLTDREIAWSSSNNLVASVNNNGRVTGVAPGTATITATSEGIQGTAFVRVSLLGPAAIAIVSGNDQQAEKKTTLPQPLVVHVTDAIGNGVPSVTVQWGANRGGTVDPSSSTTNSSGHASTSWTLGEPVGEHNATASVGDLPVVTFTATATAPASEELSWTGWSSQPH
jgi:trimeric autotransporter adhesin